MSAKTSFWGRAAICLARCLLGTGLAVLLLVGILGLRPRWVFPPGRTVDLHPVTGAPPPAQSPSIGSVPAALRDIADKLPPNVSERLREVLARLETTSWEDTCADWVAEETLLAVAGPVCALDLSHIETAGWSPSWGPDNWGGPAQSLETIALALCAYAHLAAGRGMPETSFTALGQVQALAFCLGNGTSDGYVRAYRLSRLGIRHLLSLAQRDPGIRTVLWDEPERAAVWASAIPSGADVLRRDFVSTIEHIEWTLGATDEMFPGGGPGGPMLRRLPLLHRLLVAPREDTLRNFTWLYSACVAASEAETWDAWGLEDMRRRITTPGPDSFWRVKDPLGCFFAQGEIDRLLDVLIEERSWQALFRCFLVWQAVSIYQHDTESLPASLDMLVPRYLDQAPQDPFGHGAIVYRKGTEGNWTVYSVGADGTDNGGVAPGWFSEAEDGFSDLLFKADRQ